MCSLMFEGIKEATICDSYETCLANLRGWSFMRSHEGEKHIQRVRKPVTETRCETKVPDANTVDRE
jgi:hypothetical protein